MILAVAVDHWEGCQRCQISEHAIPPPFYQLERTHIDTGLSGTAVRTKWQGGIDAKPHHNKTILSLTPFYMILLLG